MQGHRESSDLQTTRPLLPFVHRTEQGLGHCELNLAGHTPCAGRDHHVGPAGPQWAGRATLPQRGREGCRTGHRGAGYVCPETPHFPRASLASLYGITCPHSCVKALSRPRHPTRAQRLPGPWPCSTG